MLPWLQARLAQERGANILEYSLLMAFIALVVIAAVTFVGQETMSNIDAVKPGFGG